MRLLSRKAELSLNRQAFPLVQEVLLRSEQLRVKVRKQNEVTVVDCGVHVPGGWEAGVLFASICLGGLARVALHWSDFNGLRLPAVEVVTDHPDRACLASQYAGWPIRNGAFFAMVSGPGRAVVHAGTLFEKLGYQDDSEIAIVCMESNTLPTEEAVRCILEVCRCDPANLYILIAPTASLVGSVQIAARALETGLSKLMELDYDVSKILSGWSICPLPPVANDNFIALGRTNDAILYGSTVYCSVYDEDERLVSIIKQVPSSSSPYFGQLFAEMFTHCENFYDVDPLLFSPSEIWLNNVNSGRLFHAGSLHPDLLRKSFGIENL